MSLPTLTVGMAVYGEFDSVWATLVGLRAMHGHGFEIVVVDNAPRGCRRTQNVTLAVGGRYYHRPDLNGTSRPRDAVFQFSRTDWTVCVDSHVFVAAGGLDSLRRYAAANPESVDVVSGPIVGDDFKWRATHWVSPADAPSGLWGTWAYDEREKAGAAFVIPMMGLGLFAMRTAAWPGFHRLFRGFGGEEGYLHEKVRQLGGRAVCLPALSWNHKFRDTAGADSTPHPYPAPAADHIRNLLIGHRELGVAGYEELIRDKFGKRSDPAGYAAAAAEVAAMVPFGRIDPRPARQRILAVWYTNNSAPDKLLSASLRSLQTAAGQSRHAVTVVTVPWQRVPGNPFREVLAASRGGSGHQNIVRQVRQGLEAGGPDHDIVCPVEHDVLYAPGYFDRVGDAFARHPAADVVSHHDLIGLNATGWLAVRERHEPMHQLSFRAKFFRANLERAERECAERGWAFLEPHSDPTTGLPTDERKAWVRIPPDNFAPSVHVNHEGRDGMKRLTSHGEAVFEPVSSMGGGRPLLTHPYWGETKAVWPHDVVIQITPPVTPGSAIAAGKSCSSCDNPAESAAGAIHANAVSWYESARSGPSDFHEHLPTLMGLADKVKRATQIGRWGKPSRQAVAAAGVERFVDYAPGQPPEWPTLRRLMGERFDGVVCPADGPADIADTDLLFLDLMHTAPQTYFPLKRLHGRVSSYIVVHCTATYGEKGDDGGPGVLPGLRKFLQEHPEWTVVRADENNNGLIVLSKLAADRPAIEPGKARQAWSFIKAKLTHWVKGREFLPLPLAEERLAHCWVCPLRAGNRCSKCGCYLDVVDPDRTDGAIPEMMKGTPGRVFFPDRPCPVGKWHAIDPKTIPLEMYAAD